MLLAILVAAAGLSLAFTCVWLVQLHTRNAGMIDPVWAASLGGVAMLAAGLGSGAPANRVAVLIGGGIWGLRLAAHLTRRNLGQPEDPRYRQLRDTWGPRANRKLFGFFQLQAAISMLLSIAFFVPAFSRQAAAPAALLAAAAIWCAAVAGESSADRQLRRFLRDPAHRGQVCRAGWWRYSRHPNYFFECLHWCAYTALSLTFPGGWLTLLPPLLMAWLLAYVSGVPMLEAHLAETRPGYRDYMRTTSALIPWPPRTTRPGNTH